MKKTLILVLSISLIITSLGTAQMFQVKTKTPEPKVSPEEKFIRCLYLDVYGREGDEKGINAWTKSLKQGEPKRELVIRFINQDEYVRKLVINLYAWFYDREPDEYGLESWIKTYKEKKWTESELVFSFCNQDEFWDKAGGTSRGFVTRLYRTLYSREPDQKGLDGYSDAIDKNIQTRQQVIKEIMKSEEYRVKYVKFIYNWYYKREPDPKGLVGWTKTMGEAGEREVVIRVLCSDEYWDKAQKRFKP
jgi:hypothetical protein